MVLCAVFLSVKVVLCWRATDWFRSPPADYTGVQEATSSPVTHNEHGAKLTQRGAKPGYCERSTILDQSRIRRTCSWAFRARSGQRVPASSVSSISPHLRS